MSHEKNVGQIHHVKIEKKNSLKMKHSSNIGNANNKSELHALRG